MARYRPHPQSSRQQLLQKLGVGSIDDWLREQTKRPDRNTQTCLGNGKALHNRINPAKGNLICASLSW